jgi:hypothetical protein
MYLILIANKTNKKRATVAWLPTVGQVVLSMWPIRVLYRKRTARTEWVDRDQTVWVVSWEGTDSGFTCKIWGFHGGDYEEWCFLECYAVWVFEEPTFQRNLAPPSSRWQESVNYSSHPDEGCAKFLRNVGSYKEPHGVTSQKTPFFSGFTLLVE